MVRADARNPSGALPPRPARGRGSSNPRQRRAPRFARRRGRRGGEISPELQQHRRVGRSGLTPSGTQGRCRSAPPCAALPAIQRAVPRCPGRDRGHHAVLPPLRCGCPSGGRRWTPLPRASHRRPRRPGTAQSGRRGELKTAGFRNRDLRRLLFPTVPAADEPERRRRSAKLGRQLRLLRAHDLIKRIPRTHRYQLTQRGRLLTTALLATRDDNIESLLREAA